MESTQTQLMENLRWKGHEQGHVSKLCWKGEEPHFQSDDYRVL